MVKALDLGALGFIPKSLQREVMRSALQLVIAGGIYIPPEILTRHSRHTSPADLGLTERQFDVLNSRDARKEQRGDLPRTRSGGADGQQAHGCNSQGIEEIRARVGVAGSRVPSLLHCMSLLLADAVEKGLEIGGEQ